MELKEGKIYKNKSNGCFCHIKEITCWSGNPLEGVAFIVCGDDTKFRNDSKTNIMRKVWNYPTFVERYEEEEKNLRSKLLWCSSLENCNGEVIEEDVSIPVYKEKDVSDSVKELLEEMPYNYIVTMEDMKHIVKKVFGKLLVEE